MNVYSSFKAITKMSTSQMGKMFGVSSSSMWVMVKKDHKLKGLAAELFKIKMLIVKSHFTGEPLTLDKVGIINDDLPYLRIYFESLSNAIPIEPVKPRDVSKHIPEDIPETSKVIERVFKNQKTATHSNSVETKQEIKTTQKVFTDDDNLKALEELFNSL